MDDIRFGAALRAARVRRGWRQLDLAIRAGLSDSLVSRIERGHLDGIQLGTLRAIAAVLEVRVELLPRSRAADLDRLINAKHAALTEAMTGWLRAFPGWELRPEYSFSVYGERGVIDLIGWHARSRALLECEHKSDIVDWASCSEPSIAAGDLARRLSSRLAGSRQPCPRCWSSAKATRTGAASGIWPQRSTLPSRTGSRAYVTTCAIRTTPFAGSCSSQTVAPGNLSTASRPFAASTFHRRAKTPRNQFAAGVRGQIWVESLRPRQDGRFPHDKLPGKTICELLSWRAGQAAGSIPTAPGRRWPSRRAAGGRKRPPGRRAAGARRRRPT